MAKSIPGQSNLFHQATCEGSASAISSLVSEVGPRRFDSRGGQTTAKSGPEAVPASRGLTPTSGKVADKATPIRGIFGLPGFASSKSAGLQSCLESRLRQRLGAVGSTKCSATWSVLITPAGRRVPQRAVSELIMVGAGYGSWPTPAARDGKDISRSNAFLSQRQSSQPVDGDPLALARQALAGHYGGLLPCDGLSVVMERDALRGYGNTIVPALAAVFIQAYDEAREQTVEVR
jgi:hypothetical protein